MSFIAELKQRKVFRVGAAYLVVAWLLVQVADVALPAFDAPAWALRVVILLFALGFALALLLAWALEWQPGGIAVARRRVGNKRMAALAAAVVALALGWYFVGQPAVRQHQAAAERSIAVLPFVNMSGDKANDYFSDGLAETTLDMLAQVGDLKVIARTSSFAFKGRNADMREIGRALDAAHLLEGSVQQAGDTVRITAQLIRVSDGSHLWSKRFDRKLADVFAIQDEIATEVVRAIQGALPAVDQARLVRKRTDNVAAYDEYLHGIALMPERNTRGLRRALAHFERAIELDPGYARAWAMAGTSAGLLRVYGDDSPGNEAKIGRYIDRALELAPDLGEAWIARGAQLEWAGQLDAAEQTYQRGIALAPGYATGFQWLGEFYQDQKGDVARALALLERARALDPLSPIIRKELASSLASVRRLDEAEGLLREVLARQPDFAPAHADLAQVHGLRGDLVAALRAVDQAHRLDPQSRLYRGNRCHLLMRFGAVDEATRCAHGFIATFDNEEARTAPRARLLIWQGRFAQALALMESSGARDAFGPWDRVQALIAVGRLQEAGTLLRSLPPGHFPQGVFATPPETTTNFLDDALMAGLVRLDAGEREAGTRLLEAAATAAAARPAGDGAFARNWIDVLALGRLGRNAQACAALRASVQAGHFTGLDGLDHFPGLDDLRQSSCYREALAQARARAHAEVERARAAGLLSA